MISPPKDKARNIPRWRRYRIAAANGELSAVRKRITQRSHPAGPSKAHERNLSAWRARPDVQSAAELVLSAIVTDRRESHVFDAARELVADHSKATSALRELADGILFPSDGQQLVKLPRVKIERALAHAEPRNPMAWVDLSLAYSTVGLRPKAERALKIAVGLAPNNRHVMRSAAAFYSHVGDPEQANDLLERCAATRHDPWLASAEIATATAAARTSKLVKKARDEIRRGEFRYGDVSELAAAVATTELASGNASQSKKMFRVSLQDPTENALAQAEWTAKHRGISLDIPHHQLKERNAFEATAWESYFAHRWKDCEDAAWLWMDDQPFAAEPALFGSVVASDLQFDEQRALQFIKRGLDSNPGDPMLYNNQAVAFARMYRMAEARQSLDRALALLKQDDWYRETVLTATRGLVAFRSGDVKLGRQYYNRAIKIARDKKYMTLSARALIYFLQEEVSNYPPLAPSVMNLLTRVQRARGVDDPLYPLIEGVKMRLEILVGTLRHAEAAPELDLGAYASLALAAQ